MEKIDNVNYDDYKYKSYIWKEDGRHRKQNRKNPKKGASLKPTNRRFSSFVRYFCVSRLRSLSQPFREKEA